MSKKTAAPTVAAMPKAEIIEKYATAPGDTGSPEVQIALLTGRIAHLTDMHVQPEKRAGEGYRAALESIPSLAPNTDLLITGGDHVMDVMSQDADRAKVQWDLYERVMRDSNKLPVRAVLGNHDVWGWNNDGVSKDAKGYGKALALDRLQMPRSYYAFDAGGWHVIVLDSVSPRDRSYVGALGVEQTEWLKGDLAIGSQLGIQLLAATIAAVYAGLATWAIAKVVDALVGLRIAEHGEEEGLDLHQHGESGYNL